MVVGKLPWSKEDPHQRLDFHGMMRAKWNLIYHDADWKSYLEKNCLAKEKKKFLSEWRDRFFFAVGKDSVLFTIGNGSAMTHDDDDDSGVTEGFPGLSIN